MHPITRRPIVIAVPVLAIIVAVSLVWSLAAPSSTPNNWLPSHRQEQPASADAPRPEPRQ
jgi:hypothetical protein